MKNLFKFFFIFLFFAFYPLIFTTSAHAQAPRVYVTNTTDNTVSVIDTGSNSVITTIHIGQSPSNELLSPDGTRLYVANEGDNTLSVIDTSTNSVITAISIGSSAGFMSIDASKSRLYVPLGGSNSVLIINTQTNAIENTIVVGSSPIWSLLSKDRTKLYVGVVSLQETVIIDTQNFNIIGAIPGPYGVSVLSPDGSKLYSGNGSDTIYVVDTSSESVIATITVNPAPAGISISPDGSRVYVSNNHCCQAGEGNGTVTVIDTSTNSVVGVITVGPVPSYSAVSPDGSTLYVANNGSVVDPSSNTVSVVDLTTNLETSRVVVGNNPNGVVIGVIPQPNHAPVVGQITAPSAPVKINTPITAQASFTDADTADTHTAIWDWGDGTTTNPDTTTGTVSESNGSGTVGADTHTYTQAGVYTITLTVTDNHGASGVSAFQYVSVYNPTSQGLFSAGSKFSSPQGAYAANPSLTGDVKFGLSYKYQGTMPVGDKQFTMDFKAGSLAFNATTVSSLVIANGIATLTGTGTITGSNTTYNFLVTGSESATTIRIQITDPSNNNNVIYDTQPSDPVTAAPTNSVSGHVLAH